MSKDRDLTSLRQELDNIQNLNASFREQLERTHKENSILTDDNTYLRKKLSSLQQENNNSHNECLRLESEMYQQGQEVERLKKENVGFLKNKREVERKLREETQAFEKDRIVWQERESELIDQVKALQETVSVLAQQNEQAIQKRNEDSPPDTPTLGPNSHYLAIREAKNAQRTIKELEKRNNEITAELDKAKQATQESMNTSKSHVRRVQQLETELSQVKHMHQSLMEENEAFQLLLHEKTMKGEFLLNPIMQRNDSYSEKKNTDIAEKVTNGDVSSSPQEDDNLNIFKDSYLAAELNRASVLSTSLLGERVHKESDHTIIESKLQEEIKSLKDANKSMRLYIEKILNRILEAQGFEELLSSEWAYKPPASPVTPVNGSFNFNNANANANPAQEENKSKKIERRKTLSGWHFRSTSQPQNNFKNDKIITEEPEQYHTLRKSNDDSASPLSDVPRRPQRRNSSSGSKNTKRFSLFTWGSATKEEEKKDDPYMRPIILVQGQGKDRKE